MRREILAKHEYQHSALRSLLFYPRLRHVISDELFSLITHLNHELKIHNLLLSENKWMHFSLIYTTSLRVSIKRNSTKVLHPNSKGRRTISITLWPPYLREL
jgi:hypothetical protein